MVHDNCWQIEMSYEKDDKTITVRDVPMNYHPMSFATVFHHDFPGTDMDVVCRKFEKIDITRSNGFAMVIYIDGVRVAFGKTYFKAIYDTTKIGDSIYEAHSTEQAKMIKGIGGIRHG